jgi:hypothetical protein
MAVASVQFLLLVRNNQHGHDTLGMAVGASDICAPSSPSKKGAEPQKKRYTGNIFGMPTGDPIPTKEETLWKHFYLVCYKWQYEKCCR